MIGEKIYFKIPLEFDSVETCWKSYFADLHKLNQLVSKFEVSGELFDTMTRFVKESYYLDVQEYEDFELVIGNEYDPDICSKRQILENLYKISDVAKLTLSTASSYVSAPSFTIPSLHFNNKVEHRPDCKSNYPTFLGKYWKFFYKTGLYKLFYSSNGYTENHDADLTTNQDQSDSAWSRSRDLIHYLYGEEGLKNQFIQLAMTYVLIDLYNTIRIKENE